MREIKFRGVKIGTKGEWFYGGYFCSTTEEGLEHFIFDFINGAISVYEHTVTQFTGLKDKNGIDIYEGDIMKFITNGFDSETFVTSVLFKNCSFQLSNNRALFYFGQSDLTKVDDGEIIGNIYQNSGLLSPPTAVLLWISMTDVSVKDKLLFTQKLTN